MSRIQPTLGDLASYDEEAFPELAEGAVPSASVSRAKPPRIISTSSPHTPPTPTALPPPQAPPPKAKSRFALQREREAAALLASQASKLNLDLEDGEEVVSITPQLVGEVVERESFEVPTAPSQRDAFATATSFPVAERRTGFPISTRIGSTFTPTPIPIPIVPKSVLLSQSLDIPISNSKGSLPSLLDEVSRTNEGVLSGMSEREILNEQRSIRESLGLSDGILRMLEERGRKKATTAAVVQEVEQPTVFARSTARPPIASSQVKEEVEKPISEEEEGTPEYIRRHFFPNEPSTNSSLEWMMDPSSALSATSTDPSINLPTFDLNGNLIASESFTPSSHPASHSHHSGSSSQFTLPSLLSLTTSSVPSQRSSAFLILERILRKGPNRKEVGDKIWRAVRIDCARNCGWSIRERNDGVASAALALLTFIFESELEDFLATFDSDGSSIAVPEEVPVEGAEAPPTILSAFLSSDPYPTFSRYLSNNSTQQKTTHGSILKICNSILHLSSHGQAPSLALEELIASPSLLENLNKRFVAVPWPPLPDQPALPEAIRFFVDLASSSRSRAELLVERKLTDSGLRFFGILPWEVDAGERDSAFELVGETLNYWETLAYFGLGTNLRTRGGTLLDKLLAEISSFLRDPSSGIAIEKRMEGLIIRTFALLETWLTAAIDPHATNHDILWTQADDWRELGLEGSQFDSSSQGGNGIAAASYSLLSVWLEGSKVNKPWRGEAERSWILEKLGSDFVAGGKGMRLIEGALRRLGTGEGSEVDEELVIGGLRLSEAYKEDSNPTTGDLFTLDSKADKYDLSKVFATLLRLPVTPLRTNLLVKLLPSLSDPALRLDATLNVVAILGLEDQEIAKDLISWILIEVATPEYIARILQEGTGEIDKPALINVTVLRPFLSHALNTSIAGSHPVPLHPTSKDITTADCHTPFCTSKRLLTLNWPLVVLDELLRSGSSTVFENLPAGWDATELQLLRSSLALMRTVQSASLRSSREREGKGEGAAEVIFDLIKVFMLEKDNLSTGKEGAESDLFRHGKVEASMRAILQPLSIGSYPSQIRSRGLEGRQRSTIETVSSRVSSAPFYRLYTDLLGLFDSISMSHPIFSQIILPTLAMHYPIDYRKLFWVDYSQVLSTVKTTISSAISDNPGENAWSSFLYPVETDIGLLIAYAEALITGKVTQEANEFLWSIAVHHLSTFFFLSPTVSIEGQRDKLVRGIQEEGPEGLVESLVAYEQTEEEGSELRVGCACFVARGDAWEGRKRMWETMVGMIDQ